MRWLAQTRMALLSLFRRRHASAQLDDEIRDHLERQIEENLAAGMTPVEARFAALREFGNPALLRDQARATWRWDWLESITQDFRFTARALARRLDFTATVIATMALGIGAAAAMFTVVDHVIIHPVSYPDPDRLVQIVETDKTGKGTSSPLLDVQEWERATHSFKQIAVLRGMVGRNYLEGSNAAFQIDGLSVSGNLFTTLGVQPFLGRAPLAESPNLSSGKNPDTVVLSYSAWKEAFAGDQAIIGKAAKINDNAYTIVGVMPPGFSYPAGISTVSQVWTSLALTPDDHARNYESPSFSVIARLADGATIQSARNELSLLQKRIATEYVDPELRNDHTAITVQPYTSTLVAAGVRTAVLALLAASGVLWLIACLNVTNLLLARNISQRREIAMRIALGANRGRVAQQIFVESFTLNCAAALLGIGLAIASVKLLAHELSQALPLPAPATLDHRVLLALLGITVLSTFISAAWPAFLAMHAPVEPALKQGGVQTGTSKAQNRMRGALVAVEIAMSLTLLVTCGLLLRTIYTLRHVPLGYRTDHIIVANLNIPTFRFKTRDVTGNLYDPILDRVQHLYGVDNAGFISSVPLGKTFLIHLTLKMNGQSIAAFMKPVTPGIQSVFGFPMLAGRFFNAQDTPHSELVAVVNPAFARLYAPDKHDPSSVVGLKFWSFRKDADTHIVGILDDQRQAAITRPSQPEVEICLCQLTPESKVYQPSTVAMDLAVRTSRSTQEMIPEIRNILRQARPELENTTITTMDQIVEDSYGSQRLAAHLLEIFGGSALLLCIAGLYGLLAYLVSQQTRELGVRIALGANRGTLLWMVMRRAAIMLLAGVAVGIVTTLASDRLVARFLYGVSPHDGWTLAIAPALLFFTGLLAAYIPARRAASVDPMQALRAE